MENENVVADNSNTAEEEVLETSNEATDEETSTDDVEEVKSRLAKAEELAQNYKIRAEKAEKLAKSVKIGEVAKPVSGDLSTKDLYALIDAKVPEEDIEEVREYAQLKKISVSDALKSNIVKTILKDKAENRIVANASNTSASKRGSGKVSDEIVLESARQGKTTDPEALAKARFAEKLKGIN